MQGEREVQFRAQLEERSRKILDQSFVENEWLRFCEQHKHGYMASLLGFNRVMHKLNRNGLLFRLLYSKRPLLGVRNLVQCETHREAIQTIFDHNLL
jgi:poly-gamma-glutamate synthesis protein (capsule biosynthesis protein)